MAQGWWSSLKQGDWCLEERIKSDGTSYGVFLCVLEGKESSVRLPEEIVAAVKAANLVIDRSVGWE